MNRRTVLLVDYYRLPHADVKATKDLGCNLERATAEKKEVVFMGDLKCNMLAPSHQLNKLLSVTENYNLFQLITEPTRVIDSILFVTCKKAIDRFAATKALRPSLS